MYSLSTKLMSFTRRPIISLYAKKTEYPSSLINRNLMCFKGAFGGCIATSFPGYSHDEEYPGTGARFLGRILKLF